MSLSPKAKAFIQLHAKYNKDLDTNEPYALCLMNIKSKDELKLLYKRLGSIQPPHNTSAAETFVSIVVYPDGTLVRFEQSQYAKDAITKLHKASGIDYISYYYDETIRNVVEEIANSDTPFGQVLTTDEEVNDMYKKFGMGE